MRIGLDISKALSPHDGIGRFSRQLLEALTTERGDDQLWLYAPVEPVDKGDLRKSLGGFPAGVRFRAGGRPDRDRLDVFHSTTWAYPPGLTAPVLFTCYDLTFLTHAEFHTLKNKVHCLTGTLKAHLKGATFLTISRATAEELQRQIGVPANRIRVVYPAPAKRFRRRDGESARRRVAEKLLITQPYLLTVGTHEPRKNLGRLVEAYAGLPEEMRDAHPLLVAGGGGWGDEPILDQIVERPDLVNVRLLGRVDNDDLVALYNAARLFVYPSLAEGFGLPVVEAMSCGAPVVTSNRSSLAEVAADAARLVDPEDIGDIRRALEDLLGDPAERSRLVARGVERAAEFSWRNTAREVLDLYREIAP